MKFEEPEFRKCHGILTFERDFLKKKALGGFIPTSTFAENVWAALENFEMISIRFCITSLETSISYKIDQQERRDENEFKKFRIEVISPTGHRKTSFGFSHVHYKIRLIMNIRTWVLSLKRSLSNGNFRPKQKAGLIAGARRSEAVTDPLT